MMRALLSIWLAVAAAAQDPATDLRSWLLDYQSGAIRFQHDGKTDDAVIADLDRRLAATAAEDTLANAKLLFELARIELQPSAGAAATDVVAQQRDERLVRRSVELLYVQALLLGQHPLRKQELGLMNEGLLGLIDWGLSQAGE